MEPSEPIGPQCRLDEVQARRAGGVDPEQVRRVAQLQVLTVAVALGAAVGFGCFFVLRQAGTLSGAYALAAALVAAVGWALVRRSVPPAMPEAEQEEDESEDEGGWDVSSAIMAAVVIPIVFVLGMLLQGWFQVLVVVVMAVLAHDPSPGHVLVAIACAITVSAIVEFAVVHPLLKRWGIPR